MTSAIWPAGRSTEAPGEAGLSSTRAGHDGRARPAGRPRLPEIGARARSCCRGCGRSPGRRARSGSRPGSTPRSARRHRRSPNTGPSRAPSSMRPADRGPSGPRWPTAGWARGRRGSSCVGPSLPRRTAPGLSSAARRGPRDDGAAASGDSGMSSACHNCPPAGLRSRPARARPRPARQRDEPRSGGARPAATAACRPGGARPVRGRGRDAEPPATRAGPGPARARSA